MRLRKARHGSSSTRWMHSQIPSVRLNAIMRSMEALPHGQVKVLVKDGKWVANDVNPNSVQKELSDHA